ncbi:MAG: hypothetical protein C4341_07535 [Armatimonadota bacterium]
MRWLLLSLACLLPFHASAQRARELPAVRLDPPPVIDGIVEAQEWASAASSKGFVDRFSERLIAEFNTFIYAGYTEEGAYFAIVAHDPNPGLIRATEYRREGNVSADDSVSVQLNPFGTLEGQDWNTFTVNPRGATQARFAGGRATKREWQGEWLALARTTDTGWEAEFFIPWRILRVPGEGKHTMTLNFERRVPRAQLELQWSSLGPERLPENTGRWVGVELPRVPQPHIFQLLPFVVASMHDDKGASVHSGVDGRMPLSRGLTGLLTINPDFENIENAVVGIDFSRFERLADETRPFFTEGEEFFRFGGTSVRMFAPQRIGQIDAGLKAFGKISTESSVSALFTQRFGREEAAVLRYQRVWGANAELTFGYVLSDKDDVRNHSFGVDGRYRLSQQWSLNGWFAATDDSDKGNGYRSNVSFSYRTGGLTVGAGWQRVDSEFLPRLGFAPRRGFEGVEAFGFYRKSYDSGALAQVEANLFANSRNDVETGGLFEKSVSGSVKASFRKGPRVELGHNNSAFPALADRRTNVVVRYPSDDPIRNGAIEYAFGTVDAMRYEEIRMSARWRFLWGLSASASLQFVSLAGDMDAQHVFNVSYELSEFQSVSGRAIFRDGEWNVYATYRFSGDFGPEYFVIIGDPNARTFRSRIALKVVLPFDLILN